MILDNLIENAIEYGGPGSTVTIDWVRGGEIARAGGQRRRARGAARRGGAGLRALPPRGARATSPGPGSASPIVRALAERWGGAATIRNRAGGGARAEVLAARCGSRAGSLPSILTVSWTMPYRPVASVAS